MKENEKDRKPEDCESQDSFPEEYNIEDSQTSEYNLETDDAESDSQVEYYIPDPDEHKDSTLDSKKQVEKTEEGPKNGFMMLFSIMSNPVQGWKELRRSKNTASSLTMQLLLPICILAGVSDFCELFYDSNLSLSQVSLTCVYTFFTFFLSYYLSVVINVIFLPKVSKSYATSRYGEMMSIVGISTLALFHITESLLPIFDMIFAFLPLWTIYLIIKGMGFVKVKNNKGTYTLGVVCVSIICSPLLTDWLFSFLI